VVGIITERDLLHAQVEDRGPFSLVKVGEVMTTTLITASPTDSVEQIMGLMTTNRVRHLPVLDQGRLVGIISIGDVVKAQLERLAMENRFLKDYIQR
jgi:CBS domain-containing protein